MAEVSNEQGVSGFPKNYAYLRQWGMEFFDISRYSAIEDNWKTSQESISNIQNILSGAEIHDAVRAVAAAGSLGRMEASQLSDADLIIVLKDGTDLNSDTARDAFNSVWTALNPLGLTEPKKTGVFSTPCSEEQLCGPEVGSAIEELRIFGKRLLLLLESQPLLNEEEYDKLIHGIVRRYASQYVEADPRKEWAFLLNDLLRYFRALCVNYQWDFENDKQKWPIRNIKLRHSRLIMYSGLLFLLGEASKERTDKVQWLKDRLYLTPLERIAHVYHENLDWSFPRIAGLYNVFLSRLNDSGVRELLQIASEEDSEKHYDERYLKAQYADLKANSDALIAELLRFVLRRRGIWSERFFEYLIF